MGSMGETVALFGADISGFMTGLATMASASGSFAGVLAAGLAVATAALIGFGAASVDMAGNFQQGVSRLVTGAGDVTDNMTKMGQGILATSVATGVLTSGTAGLNAAMYLIISSGQRGSQALDTLTVSAKGAVTEQANVVDVANAVSGAMTNYGTKQFNATQYMNGFIEAVKHGKISLEQLSTTMGPLEPIAASLGIRFADLAGAMSTMTNANIPAERAATSLRFVMQSLENPTHKASAAMQQWGLDTVAVANEMKVSLPGAMQMIYDAAKRAGPEGSVPFNRAVSDMIGGQRSLQAFLALTGAHLKDFKDNSNAVTTAMKASRDAVQGWETAQKNFNVQMGIARAAVAALMIVIGTALLPVLTQILSRITPLITAFTSWATSGHAVGDSIAWLKNNLQIVLPIVIPLGVAIASVLVPAVVALAAGVIAATWPFIALGVGIALVVVIFQRMYTAFPQVRQAVTDVGHAFQVAGAWIAANFVPAMQQVWAVIMQVAGWLNANFIPAVGAVAHAFQQAGAWAHQYLLPPLIQIGAFLAANFMPLWTQLVALWRGTLFPALTQLWAAIQKLEPVLKLVGGLLLVVAAIIGVVVVMAILALVIGLAAVAKGLAGFLSGLMNVVAGVVILFTGLTQIVTGVVTFIVDLVQGHFDKLAGDLGMIWQGILNMFRGVWSIIAGIFQTAWFTISGIVTGLCDGIIGVFTALMQALVGGSIVPDMVNNIVMWFLQLPGRVGAAVSSMVSTALALFARFFTSAVNFAINFVNGVMTAFGQLAGRAGAAFNSMVSTVMGILNGLASSVFSVGSAIVQNIANGIMNGISFVTGAINSVVSSIWNALPHSPAKEGPLRDLDLAGPAIAHSVASGMLKGIPEVKAAVAMMVKPVSGAVSANVTAKGIPFPGGTGAGGPVTLIVQFDSREVARVLIPSLAKETILQVGGVH